MRVICVYIYMYMYHIYICIYVLHYPVLDAGTYAVPYVGIVPDIPNAHNISAIIRHRVGHQSCLDESSGQRSTIF